MPDSNDPFKKVTDLGYAGAGVAGSLAVKAATLGPLAAGAYFGFNKMVSNKDYALRGLGTGPIRDVNTSVGQNLSSLREAKQALATRKAEELRQNLLSTGQVKKVLEEGGEQRRALIASVLEILDDPGSGLNAESKMQGIRENLVKLLDTEAASAIEDEEKIIKSILTTVLDSGSAGSRDRFAQARERLANYGTVLQSPAEVELRGLRPKFNNVEVSALQSNRSALSAYNRVRDIVGNDGNTVVKLMQGRITGVGEDVFEAHIMSGSRGRERVRIRLNAVGEQNLVRTAQGTTTASVKQNYISASRLLEATQLAAKVSAEEGISKSAAMARVMNQGGFRGSFVDFQLDVLKRMVSERGVAGISSKDFYAQMSEVTDQVSRAQRMSSIDPAYAAFSKGYSSVRSNQTLVYGMEDLPKGMGNRFVPEMVAAFPEYFDPAGIDPVRRTEMGTTYTTISMREGGTLSNLRGFGGIPMSRYIQPVTAREQQFIGRKAMFVESNAAVNRIASTMGMSSAQSVDLAFMFNPLGPNASGAAKAARMGRAHRVAILNLADDALTQLGLGEGQSYVGGTSKMRIREDLTKTSIDLSRMKKAAPAFYNELIHARKRAAATGGSMNITIGDGATYTTKSGKVISSVDEFFDMFGAGGKGAGISFSEGEVAIPRYQGMTRLNIALAEATEIAAKDNRTLLHFAGTYDINPGSSLAKLFGALFKGTARDLTGTVQQNLEKLDFGGGLKFSQLLSKIGVGAEDVLLTEGAMLKKSPVYLAYQMIGGGAIAGGVNVNDFFERVTQGITMPTETTAKAYQSSFKRQIAAGVATALSSNQAIDTQKLGMVFAAFEKQEGEEALRSILAKSGFGGQRLEEVMTSARGQYAFGLESSAAGPKPSDLRGNLASMEPRTYKFLQSRLQNMLGLGVDETSKLMTSFIARLNGVGDSLKVLENLTMMAESIGPGAGVTDVRYRNLPRITTQEFTGSIAGTSDMAEFLSREKFSQGGFLLQLDEAAAAALGRKEIFIAGGKDMIEKLPNVLISGGEEKQILQNEYVRRVSQFASDLSELDRVARTGMADSVRKAQESVKSFRKDFGSIYGSAFRELLRGRLRGSGMAIGGAIVMPGADPKLAPGSLELTAKQQKLVASVPKMSGGSNLARAGGFAFADTETFLASMKTYMGGETDSIIARTGDKSPKAIKAAKSLAKQDAGEMFRRFFLGMEGDKGRMGVTSVVTRHPQLAPTHVTGLEIFRNVTEVGDEDIYFKRFTQTAAGEAALKDVQKTVGKKISSFAEMSSISSKEGKAAVRRLFTTMAENISSFATGEGGGKLLFPSMVTDVHFAGMTEARRMDLSLASGMIGDFDGDIYQLLFPSKATRQRLSGMSQEALEADFVGRLMTRAFVEETKAGIKNYASQLSGQAGITLSEELFEAAQKEIYGKNIGELDIALDRMRMGVVSQQHTGEAVGRAQRTLGLLTALEEIGLKSKKAQRAIPITEELTSAVRTLLDTGGESTDRLQGALRKIFEGTQMGKTGSLKVTGINMEGAPPELQKLMQRVVGQEVTMVDLMDDLRTAAITANQIGAEAQKNAKTMMMAMTRQDRRNFYSAQIGSPQGQMMQGARMAGEDALDARVTKVMTAMQDATSGASAAKMASSATLSRMMMPVAIGAAASIAVGSLIGDDGYAPTPMVMPGEFSDARVNASIMAGTATDRNVSPETLPQGSQTPDMMGRPINSGTLNITRPNSYAMRGEIVNYGSISDTMNIMSSFGASGSIIINDHRRPMSRHYMDRMFGD